MHDRKKINMLMHLDMLPQIRGKIMLEIEYLLIEEKIFSRRNYDG